MTAVPIDWPLVGWIFAAICLFDAVLVYLLHRATRNRRP